MGKLKIKSFYDNNNIKVFPWNKHIDMYDVLFRNIEIERKNDERKKKLESL